MSQEKSQRIDKLLVEKGLVSNRSKARGLILEGVVYVDNKLVLKPGTLVQPSKNLEVRKEQHFVGRGALKIEAPINTFSLVMNEKIVADIGASTGGFTDYVLRIGARKVYAIDVGHDQLDPLLKENVKVINMEGINIKHSLELPELVDFSMVDLSFISLKLVLENIFSLVKKGGEVLTLVKPQFEAGRERLGKKGVIRDGAIWLEVLEELYDWCDEKEIKVLNAMASPVLGKEGNKEFFYLLSKENKGKVFLKESLKELI